MRRATMDALIDTLTGVALCMAVILLFAVLVIAGLLVLHGLFNV